MLCMNIGISDFPVKYFHTSNVYLFVYPNLQSEGAGFEPDKFWIFFHFSSKLYLSYIFMISDWNTVRRIGLWVVYRVLVTYLWRDTI